MSADNKYKLLNLLIKTSQDYWKADWHPNVEFLVWKALEEDAVWMPDKLKKEFRALIKKSKGWWVWNICPRFIPFEGMDKENFSLFLHKNFYKPQS